MVEQGEPGSYTLFAYNKIWNKMADKANKLAVLEGDFASLYVPWCFLCL